MPTSQWERAERYGFTATGRQPSSAAPAAPQPFTAKPRSHDDGPDHGMFLGPIGGPAFSRDLSGRFNRWHLQPGRHLLADVDAAYLAVHWEHDGEHRHLLLRSEHVDRHDTAVLYPVSHERFTDEALPFVVMLSSFSPVIPGYEQESGLPVVVLDVRVEPAPGVPTLPTVDVALFWPNLNGWHASTVTSDDRGDRAWPGHHHAGNVNVAGEVPLLNSVPGTPSETHVLQGREAAVAGDDHPDTQNGRVCVSVSGSADRFSRQVQFKTDQNATGVPESEQEFTIGAVQHAFAHTGRLGVTPDDSWPAHWHEPVGSAVAGHVGAGRDVATMRFVLAFDWPAVQFGMGRTWRRAYAGPTEGAVAVPDAVELAARAHRHGDEWLAAIDDWHERTLDRLGAAGWSASVAGCVINELGLVPGLGSAWVDGTVPGHEPAQDAVLHRCEHVGLLEGFDEGYFYYNTSDLWHYAFPALTLHWPRLAEVVFADLADALAGADERTRPVYRVGAQRQMLQSHHLPHDMGSALEDPFVRLNGYVMRDDPNTWRDSAPAHVLARLLHARLAQRPVSEAVWRELCTAAEVTAAQSGGESGEATGVPRHDEFGDSTWDNLALRGYSTYAASLCTGMWAMLAHEAHERGEDTDVYEARRAAAAEVLERLWNGEFFRAASEGKYVQAVMPDSVWGLFYAERYGASTGVDREQIRGHLRAAYEICHLGYDDGRVGPLLIGERGGGRYGQDGGEELQVNEVIIGSAWMFAAMLRYYGLADEADDVASSLRNVLYGGRGLQFRTPAAVDRDGQFRAPLNLRPLAAWWLAADTPRPQITFTSGRNSSSLENRRASRGATSTNGRWPR